MILIVRGTDISQRHEKALIELCVSPYGTEESWDSCITSIVGAPYDDSENEEGTTPQCSDDGSECLLDALYDMWDEDISSSTEEPNGLNGGLKPEEQPEQQQQKAAAPWSSRSSPSGTYVLNPRTRKLERID